MFGISRAFVLSLTIIAVLVFSAVGTTAVYADEGTPPDPPPTEVVTEPEGETETGEPDTVTVDTIETTEGTETVEEAGEESEPAKETATPEPTEEAPPSEETPVPTKEPAATETASATEEPAATETASAPAEALPAETTVLDAVPDNTTVTVLDAEGESQPLATQAAAEAIALTTDPIWCPAGQAPTPGANGCTQSFNSFTALLTFLSGNATYSGAGTIYVEQGNYQGGESTVDFNNYNLSNISSADLTITGGWNTSTGTIDPTTGSTFSNVTLVIGSSTNPWGGALSLNNLNFNFSNGGRTDANGITVNAQTDINLSNVDVTNAGNNSGAGAELHAGNDVNINNSNFIRNQTAGAVIRAGGDVSIANSSFSNPADARRQITGLDIISDGSVSLFNVLANENRQVGAHIEAGGPVAINTAFFSGTQAILNGNFLGYGLTVITPGAIALNGVTANDNFLWGAMLDAGGDVSISNSIFNANTTEDPGFIDDTGLLITNAANVSIFNTTADLNRLIGATINATGDVSISNSSFSNNNGITLSSTGAQVFHGYGLQVITLGNIFINQVTASNNTLFGAHLESGLDTLVSNSNFSNQTSGSATDQTGRGLEIISAGNVLLENVILDNNQTFGANVQAGSAIFLDAITATNNGLNGVEVQGSCTSVFLINGTYTGNGQYGLSILDAELIQSGAPVFANNVLGDIFHDPGTCIFTPATPPTPPAPPVEEDDTGTTGNTDASVTAPVSLQQNGNSLARTVKHHSAGGFFGTKFSGGTLSAAEKVTLISFLGQTGTLSGELHIGIFTGSYAYIYSASGLQIIAIVPNSLNEFAINRQ